MVFSSIRHLLFPPICMHCTQSTPHQRRPLCSACLELLSLIDPELRCLICFTSVDQENTLCKECRENPPPLKHLAAAFDYMGPAATLLRNLKFHQQPGFAKSAASYMVIQWERLKWPMPDLIVPTPQSFMRWLTRGYNQSALIAEEMSKLLDRPACNLLNRSSGAFSQSRLSQTQRKDLCSHSFSLKTKREICDKTLLLIDDVITTGSTLRHCAATLQEGFPAAIYGLAFCIA